ncbi:biogenesis of lysosome-related organelles complex 1 subunit 2-like [Dromiciops gliroides]|uniref:biogenesis of lysosome-related organelles complex 1 subunit 2-like n=1 Tax=Dromiciops gliroides TaxID=33562 RepID=UPI001CC550E7|nr:biogenesis of lysosome-related organelles complex 1 subunit 2-like [Dromiciops gliroides]
MVSPWASRTRKGDIETPFSSLSMDGNSPLQHEQKTEMELPLQPAVYFVLTFIVQNHQAQLQDIFLIFPFPPSPNDAVVGTAEEATELLATYLTGELTATSEDYKLLENMNKLTSLKYLEMRDIAVNISRNLKDSNQKYAALQPYLDQITLIEEQVAALEQAAYKLDAYSKKLEAKYKKLERR